ncbi:MAG TPA: HAMP domain-containing sensor histidine kinase [Candidatus Binataceae bacterium]|nr:HAMP domain-containing sensor histidine kinase [Candidatus Binataceae bacterium]
MALSARSPASAPGVTINQAFEKFEVDCSTAAAYGGAGPAMGLPLESFANFAHELRTPVQVLLGYLDMLRTDRDEAPDDAPPGLAEQTIIERMNLNVHELAQTVDNVLEFALTFSPAKAPLEEEIVLARLFEEVDEVLRDSRRNHQPALRIDLGKAPRAVFTRRRALRSIVLNLAANALKFTPDGEVTIEVTGQREPPTLCIEVRDTGAGISGDLLSDAFAPMVQLSNSSIRRYRGLGLGLTLVQFNVKSLGGRLEVESEPGVGSCFKVTIPCSESASPMSTSSHLGTGTAF